MPTARDVLNELRWHRGLLAEAEVTYVHRGAPGDEATVRGADVLALRRSFFDLPSGASIPYHRVLRIRVRGEEVWARGGAKGKPGRRASRAKGSRAGRRSRGP